MLTARRCSHFLDSRQVEFQSQCRFTIQFKGKPILPVCAHKTAEADRIDVRPLRGFRSCRKVGCTTFSKSQNTTRENNTAESAQIRRFARHAEAVPLTITERHSWLNRTSFTAVVGQVDGDPERQGSDRPHRSPRMLVTSANAN